MAEQGHSESENKDVSRRKAVPSDLAFRTTLSTSTSSFEALDPHDPQLNQLASVAFSGNTYISNCFLKEVSLPIQNIICSHFYSSFPVN